MKAPAQPRVFATVPKILSHGGTVLVLGSGPSLTQADVDLARPQIDASIAVNDAYKLMPDATALYAADPHWWEWHHGVQGAHTVGRYQYPAFIGAHRYTLSGLAPQKIWPGMEVLKRGPEKGLSDDPGRLGLGRNGVHQAINIAVHFGASRILLLGVDMQGGHFFGHHPNHSAPPFALCLERFAQLVHPLKERGIEIINCSRKTALKCFPCLPLEEALCAPVRSLQAV